jgi:hypothetical protein
LATLSDVASRQASALASGDGRAALAPAAFSAPWAVASRACSASISASPTAPSRARLVMMCQRRSVSIASPAGASSPASQACSTATVASERAAAISDLAKASWWSEPGSASFSSRATPVTKRSLSSIRVSRGAYWSIASRAWPSTPCTAVRSVSTPTPESASVT